MVILGNRDGVVAVRNRGVSTTFLFLTHVSYSLSHYMIFAAFLTGIHMDNLFCEDQNYFRFSNKNLYAFGSIPFDCFCLMNIRI
nr:MAG TPA: hypothetical protein [Caudoviricetes sp.]